MQRLLRFRLSLLLIGLAALPLAALPFAERIRTGWKRYWEPKPAKIVWEDWKPSDHVIVNGLYLCPTDYSASTARLGEISVSDRTASADSSGFTIEQELGEAAGANDLDVPRFGIDP